jgi:two-component system nitrate/nitrite response regulator NarL
MPEPECNARILIIDDHALFRESLARFLDGEPGLRVVAGCGTIDEARDILQRDAIDLVLLDFDLGERNGLDLMRVAEDLHFRGKVLLVTAGINDSDAANLVRRGIAGIFPKHQPPELLSEAIHDVLSGKASFDHGQLQRIIGPAQQKANDLDQSSTLTERERQVLSLVFEGLTNKEISDRLQLSESSVKGTMQQLFRKTGARTRGQLVRVALENYRDQV